MKLHMYNAHRGVGGFRQVVYTALCDLVSAAPSLDKKIMIPFVCYFVQPRQIHCCPLGPSAQLWLQRMRAYKGGRGESCATRPRRARRLYVS